MSPIPLDPAWNVLHCPSQAFQTLGFGKTTKKLGKLQKKFGKTTKKLGKPQKNLGKPKKNLEKRPFPARSSKKLFASTEGFLNLILLFFPCCVFLGSEATTSAFLGCKIPFYSLCCGIEGIFSSSRPEICYLSFFFWTASLASLSLSSCAHSSEKKKSKRKSNYN